MLDKGCVKMSWTNLEQYRLELRIEIISLLDNKSSKELELIKGYILQCNKHKQTLELTMLEYIKTIKQTLEVK